MNAHPARQPAGTPVGGQFSESPRDEAEIELVDVVSSAQYALPSGRTRQTLHPLTSLRLDASPRRLKGLVDSVNEGDFDLNPPYQRGSVWNLDQRIELVRSLLSRTPVPAIVLNDRRTPRWNSANGLTRDRAVGSPSYAVIDGKQRLETMVAWYDDDFAVPASWFPDDAIERTVDTPDGPYVTWSGLSRPARLDFSQDAVIPVAEGTLATIEEEAAMYLRVNGGGTAQTEEDMLNAERVALGEFA